jgi:hypothetical protein
MVLSGNPGERPVPDASAGGTEAFEAILASLDRRIIGTFALPPARLGPEPPPKPPLRDSHNHPMRIGYACPPDCPFRLYAEGILGRKLG